MKRIRVLFAAAGAALVLGLLPAPAQASHHCMPPEGDDPTGLAHTLWVACEYGPHDPVGVTQYVICWLTGGC